MRSFVEEMKHNYFISALITVIMGIVLVMWPDDAGRFMCYLLGAALIIMGVVQLLICIRAQRFGFFSKFSMFMDAVLILLGIWICLRPDSVLALVPVVIGIVMIVHGCMDLGYTVDIKNAGASKWWIALICALVTLGLGIFLVLHPFLAFEITMVVIGAGLIYDGGSDLALMIAAEHAQRKSDKRMRDFAQNVESIHDEDL